MIKTKTLMAAMLLGAGALCASAAEEQPIITIHSTAYQEVGESNQFSLFLGTYKTDYYDVDLGGGLDELEVLPATLDPETGEWADGATVPIRATEEGVIKVYGDPENLQVLVLDGGYVESIDIEKCVNLQVLSLQHNVLRNLDLTPQKWLQYLYLSDNPFDGDTSIVLGADKPNLTVLEMDIMDKIGEGFNLSNYPELGFFDGYHNFGITSVDISACSKLTSLSLEMTGVETLDVSNNPYLVSLNIAETKITDIDISNLKHLQIFLAGHDSGWVNQGYRLNSIDLTHNPELFYLNLSGNHLGKVDISKNVNLTHLQLNRNDLTSLDLSNNDILYSVSVMFNDLDFATLPLPQETWGEYFYMQNNLPLPKAIEVNTDIDFSKRVLREGTVTEAYVYASPVGGEDYLLDDADYSYSKGVVKFNTCPSDSVYVKFTNDVFDEYALQTSKFKVKKAADMGTPSKVASLSFADANTIRMAVGMAGATATTPKNFFVDFGDGKLQEFTTTFSDEPTGYNVELKASGSYASIYIPEEEVMTSLEVKDRQLYSASLGAATELRYLTLNGCQLYDIDLKNNRCLQYLDVSNNNLYNLDLTGVYGNYAKNVLYTVKAAHNKLAGLDNFKYNDTKTFRYLDLSYNELQNFKLLEFENLDYVDLSHNQLSEELYLTYQITASHIDLSYNQLPSVVIDYFENIDFIDLSNNSFPYSTLPLPSEVNAAGTYVYAPQNVYELPAKAPAVNLTVMNRTVDGKGTVYTWKRQDGTPLTAAEVDCQEGVTKFLKHDMGEVYCEMTNPAFPAFQGADVYKTSLLLPMAAPTAVVASFKTTQDSSSANVIFAASRKTELYIDWRGDGSEYTAYPVETEYISYTDQTVYAGVDVKVYTYESPDLITVFSIHGIKMSEGDFSNLTNVTCLSLGGAGVTPEQIKLPASAPITELSFSGCQFTDFPYAEDYPDLKMLNLAGNQLTSFDASPMKNLIVLYLSNNQLTDVKFGNPKLWGLSLDQNQLSSIDLNGLPSLDQLDLGHNLFKTIDLSPVRNQLVALSLVNNQFTFSTLPLQDDFPNLNMYYYGGQAMLEGEVVDNKVDFSTAAFAGDTPSVFTWYLGEAVYDEDTQEWTGETLVEGEEYSIEDGVTTFFYPYEEKVMCLVSNELFPQLTMKSNLISLKNVGVAVLAADEASRLVDVCTLQGSVVKRNVAPANALEGLAPGFYIVGRQKVIIR